MAGIFIPSRAKQGKNLATRALSLSFRIKITIFGNWNLKDIMSVQLSTIIRSQLKKDLPDIMPGDVVRVYQKVSETVVQSKTAKKANKKSETEAGKGEKIQVFEGLVLAKKHGKGISGTITVRRVIKGIGVERIFPLHSPNIQKIEIVRRGKVRRSKLYYLRKVKGKRGQLKTKEFIPSSALSTEK